jgi:hypothetical protein
VSVGWCGHVEFELENSVAGTCNASVVVVGIGRHGKGWPMCVVFGNVMEVLLKLRVQSVTVTVVVAVDTELQLVLVVHVSFFCDGPWSAPLVLRSRCFSACRRL